MYREWVYLDTPLEKDIKSLSESLNVNTYIAKILLQRGITSYSEAEKYFCPSLDMLHDPFLMDGMDLAVNRLINAVQKREKIMLYGDYDVDGTTAVSVLFLFLKKSTENKNIIFYIPDRYTEGYGLSIKGIDYAIQQKVNLIIALDCGITAVDEVAYAHHHSIDCIICDHHLPSKTMPKALSVLDPKKETCDYPFKELSGCGVGFKLLEGFCIKTDTPKSALWEYLDLVAVSIASDLVSMVEENRVLMFFGLKKLNENPLPGLWSLLKISGRNVPLSVSDIVFGVAPMINAAGRMTHAKESVNVLIGEKQNVTVLDHPLKRLNTERRNLDREVTEEALLMIKDLSQSKSTVLYKKGWSKGVLGIVASRCIEKYYRPTIILTESEGKATGSARSIKGFNIYHAISQCGHLLDHFGGHAQAAGLSLPVENIDAFSKHFEKIVEETIHPDLLIPKQFIETELPLSYVNFKTYKILQRMNPFGPMNLSPLFYTENVFVKQSPQILKDKHIKGILYDFDEKNVQVPYIGFNLEEKKELMYSGTLFKVLYHIELNEFRGNKELFLNIKDIKN